MIDNAVRSSLCSLPVARYRVVKALNALTNGDGVLGNGALAFNRHKPHADAVKNLYHRENGVTTSARRAFLGLRGQRQSWLPPRRLRLTLAT